MIKILFFAFTILFFTNTSNANSLKNDPDKFVQFYISNLESKEQAVELRDLIKAKDGVKMVRFDEASKTAFIIFSSEKNYSESDFATWLSEANITFTCFNSGVQGVDQVLQLKYENCIDR